MLKQAHREMSLNVANGRRPQPEIGVRLFGVTRRELIGYLASAVLLAILLSTAGAFDSDEVGPAHRLALWLIVSLLAVTQTLALDGLIAPRLPQTVPGRTIAAAIGILGVIALMTIELHLLKYTPLLTYARDPLLDFFLFLAPPVGAIATIIVLTRILAPEGLAPRRLPLDAPEQTRLLEHKSPIVGYLPAPTRLADWPSEPVTRVRAADHYLEVFTATGRRFIRGRMKDALRELSGAEGIQPHRSWWVATFTIKGTKRTGRDIVFVTHDGAEIPIARTRIPALRGQGLFQPHDAKPPPNA